MSSFQRTNIHSTKKPSVNQSMESQILSMLKGVIIDENPMMDYSELDENIFDDNSSETSNNEDDEEIPFKFNESDIDQTSSNQSSFFKREQTEKSQTTKFSQKPFPINPYNNDVQRQLFLHKKFPTQSLKPEQLNLITNNPNLNSTPNFLNISVNSCSSQQYNNNNFMLNNKYYQYSNNNYPTYCLYLLNKLQITIQVTPLLR